jgi:dihydroorotase
METLYKGMTVFSKGAFAKKDVSVKDGSFADYSRFRERSQLSEIVELNDCYMFPGFADVHVHLREPGFSYKETIKTGTMAAARGGFTHVCAMPNLNPVPDGEEGLKAEADIIIRDARVKVYPYGSITAGEMGEKLSDMDKISDRVIAFSDDGRGVQSEEVMRQAMKKAKSLGRLIAAHCEDNSLISGGYVHEGCYAAKNGLKGISAESEYRQLERDLRLVRDVGCKYHMCHISTKESVALIRKAKAEGLDVTCETAPHYILLNDMMLKDEGRFKMNPPLRSEGDRQAIIEGLIDGTIDMIATDHAPHSAAEKAGGLKNSLNGIVGLETAFPALYTGLVKSGIISLSKLIDLMHTKPCERFKIGGDITGGAAADFTVFDLNSEYTIDSNEFLSMGKSTPFDGMRVYGRCLMTAVNGRIVWKDSSIRNIRLE